MKSPLTKAVRNGRAIYVLFFLLVLASCKKQPVEVTIDAFAQVNPEVSYTNDAYNIQFTLQEFPYTEVIVKVAESKAMIIQNAQKIQINAYQMSLNRYGVFINNLTPNKTYFYQILVKDANTSREAYSDVYSFSTNP